MPGQTAAEHLRSNVMRSVPVATRAVKHGSPSAGSSAGTLTAVVVSLSVLLLGGLSLFHAIQRREGDAIEASNRQMQTEIDATTSRLTEHARIVAELSEHRQREAVVQQLLASRTDPSVMLLEVARILSPVGPTRVPEPEFDGLRYTHRSLLWSPTWNVHRATLSGLQVESRTVRFQGEAIDADDVGEFVRRLQLSRFFHDVRLETVSEEQRVAGARDGSTPARRGLVQRFSVRATFGAVGPGLTPL